MTIELQTHEQALKSMGFALPRSPRTGETPEQILNRLAARLNCEPRQVADRVIRMLEERKRGD